MYVMFIGIFDMPIVAIKKRSCSNLVVNCLFSQVAHRMSTCATPRWTFESIFPAARKIRSDLVLVDASKTLRSLNHKSNPILGADFTRICLDPWTY